jgi:hypothetical protein
MKLPILISLLLLTSACTRNLGQFTVASSSNVANLHHGDNKVSTSGDSCIYFMFGRYDGRIQAAMDEAIKKGKSKEPNGDMLINTRIDLDIYPFVDCVVVRGDLVSSKM